MPAEDVDALERALETYLYDDDAVAGARANVQDFAHQYAWSTVLRPLVEFCRLPRRAADLNYRVGGAQGCRSAVRPATWAPRRSQALARGYLAAGGVGEVMTRAGGRMRRLMGASDGQDDGSGTA